MYVHNNLRLIPYGAALYRIYAFDIRAAMVYQNLYIFSEFYCVIPRGELSRYIISIESSSCIIADGNVKFYISLLKRMEYFNNKYQEETYFKVEYFNIYFYDVDARPFSERNLSNGGKMATR